MQSVFRRILFVLLGLSIVPACASNNSGYFAISSPPPVARYAYVANNDGTVSVYRVDTLQGQLHPDGFAAAYAGAPPATHQRVTLSPGGQICWVVTPGAPATISTYGVNATTGALTPVSVGVSLAPLTSPLALAIDPSLRFAYLADTVAGTLQSYAIGGNGALTATGNSVAVAGISAIAVHPSRSFVYVTQTGGTVSGFSVGSSGIFSALTLSPYPAGTAPSAVAIDPSGTFAFVLNQTSKDLWVYTLSLTAGELTTVAGSPFPVTALTTPSFLAVDPLDRFVWAGDSTGILPFVLDTSTGFLTPSGALEGPTTATSLSVDPSGRFAFFPTSTGTVETFPIGTTGTVTVPAAAGVRGRGTFAANMALSIGTVPVTRTPSFVYAADTGGVSGFTVTAVSGLLTPISALPFAAGTTPTSVAVDPFARFAYATDSNAAGVVSQFTINASYGTLVPIASPPALPTAQAIAVDPSGQFAFTMSGPGTINPFPISQTTGALGAKGAGLAFGTANALAVDPVGAFVIAFDTTGGTAGVQPFTFDAATGALTAGAAVPGANFTSATVSPSGRFLYVAETKNVWLSTVTSPATFGAAGIKVTLAVGTVITSLAIDPTESFLYATDSNTGQVFGFTIGAGGSLTAMSSPASFVTGAGPTGATVDPSGQFAYVTSRTGGTLWAYTLGGLGGGQLLTVAGSPFGVGATPSPAAVAATIQ